MATSTALPIIFTNLAPIGRRPSSGETPFPALNVFTWSAHFNIQAAEYLGRGERREDLKMDFDKIGKAL